MMKKISKLIFTLMVSCISLGSVFADVDVDTKTFDLWEVKAVWNKNNQTLNINGNGKVDKAKWEKLKETLSLREYVASAVRITFTDGARFPDDASSFFENVKGKISFKSTIPLDTSNVVNMRAMFAGTKFNQPIGNWNTSNVTDMSYMFSGATVFNQPLNNWDVSNVTDMSYMFAGVRYVNGTSYNRISLFNQPLWKWNVSKVTNMSHMFDGASSFNQDINNWNTSSVTDMSWLFAGALDFNKPLNNWDTSKVITMAHMFDSLKLEPRPAPDNSRTFIDRKNHQFNQPLNNWDTSKVTDMSRMFLRAGAFNQPLNNWNVSNVTDMRGMFEGARSFNQPLNNWNVSNVTDMREMFEGARSFNQPLNNWNVSNVTTMKNMFWAAEVFNQPLNNWNVSNVTDMSHMFNRASSFDQDLSNWNPKSLKTGVDFIKDTAFSLENNDRLLKWWSDKLWRSANKVSIGIDVPYCEEEKALEWLSLNNYNFVLGGGKVCSNYFLTKWIEKPITFEVDWNVDKVSEWNNFPKDLGLKITKKKITEDKTKITISGVPQELWTYRVIFKASDQQNKFRKDIILIVRKRRSNPQENTIITPNTNEKTNDNWAKDKPSNNPENDKPKKDTPVVDQVSPLNNQDPKSESLEGKKVFSDDEIFNPTIANGQCYTRRPYLWIKDSDTIITDEEFKKALSFLRTYEMTMFDSVKDYNPYRDLSRQEAAKIFSNFAINVLCRKPDLNLKVNYSDVENADPTLKPYITLAYQLGVMKGSGMGDGLFRPFDKITKAEVNAVLIRMILKAYLDESRSESKKWYSEYNKVATNLGIINQGAGSEHLSRNNVALMLFRAYKQQVFEWRLIDYYSYVLQSRDLFVK